MTRYQKIVVMLVSVVILAIAAGIGSWYLWLTRVDGLAPDSDVIIVDPDDGVGLDENGDIE
jgi:hypothetical protein